MEILSCNENTRELHVEKEINIMICDPNKEEANDYTDILKNIADKRRVDLTVMYCKTAREMFLCFEKGEPVIDAVILDVDFPNKNGFQVLSSLKSSGYKGEILFLTRTNAYVRLAFEIRAFQYLHKDKISVKYIQYTLDNLISLLMKESGEYILIGFKGEYHQIKLEDIYYFEIDKRMVSIHYKDGTFIFSSTMEKVERTLSKTLFARVHRSYLVYMPAIIGINYYKIHISNGDIIPVGRTYQKVIQAKIKKMYNDHILSMPAEKDKRTS